MKAVHDEICEVSLTICFLFYYLYDGCLMQLEYSTI